MNKKFIAAMAAIVVATAATAKQKSENRHNGYPYSQVPFTAVKVAQKSFWGQRLKACEDVTIPLAFSKCESEGRYENFVKAAHPSKDYKVTGYSFDDTDVYKTIEGASYILQTYPNKRLEHYIDSVLDIVAAAQEKDGYLYTSRTMNPDKPHEWAGPKRWSKVEDLSHEFYNLGHMIDGAVAHWQATGSTKFLNIARRYADCVVREVGPNKGQACVVPGHQIAEMALAKLYLATGEKKYLDEAKFFLDYRGKTSVKTEYSQSHQPVTEQSEAVGHAVRAGYMYAGMADVAALTGDKAYIDAIDRIWHNIVYKKYYITGGVGATASGEAFGKNYELPNMSAYCETCAAIAQVYLNHRLFLLHGNSKYIDCMERTLYNGVISGMSIDGGAFFYPNPLESMGQHQRQPWFGCACCPSNIARFIPSIPGYIYATKDKRLYVNLYNSNTSNISVNGKNVTLEETTNYPWDGNVSITIAKNNAGTFEMMLRIPGWVKGEAVPSDLYSYSDNVRLNYTVKVNGKTAEGTMKDGYLAINRKWKKGDKIELHFDMEPRTVRANNLVTADRGRIAIERGPLVYCAEWPDNDFNVLGLLMNQSPAFALSHKEIAKTNVVTLEGKAQTLNFGDDGRLKATDVKLTLIPYYAWNHRGAGNMDVWMAQDLNATTPAKAPTLASRSKLTASIESPSLSAVNDRLVPKDGDDRSMPYIHWWPKKATTEWIAYQLPEKAEVKSSTVYWFDDGPWGGCRVPKSWQIEYKTDAGAWQAVKPLGKYPVQKGAPCTVNFEPVKTTAVRLVIQQPDDYSTGVFEWEIK